MANPAIYSKPRRAKANRKTVVCKTAKGSRVYAPAGGTVKKESYGFSITTRKGVVHKVRNVNVRNKKIGKKVKPGTWVANARGKRLKYKRFGPGGKQWDAMPVATKGNDKKSGNWMPGVDRMPNSAGGDMSTGGGSEHKVVWHTTESDHTKNTIYGVARYTTSKLISYHVMWNPWTGEFVQTYPADVAARSLKNAPTLATNRHGEVCIQISIVGRKSDAPLAGGSPLNGRRKLMQWLDGHDIPRKVIDDRSRSVTSWKKSGHHTHDSCPGNDHSDPGRVNWDKLLAP